MGGLRLSKEYGLNPSMGICFVCGEESNEIVLLGAYGGKEAPRKGCYHYEPCDTCKGYMEKGIIMISVKDGSEGNNPHRTGGWIVVKRGLINRLPIEDKLKSEIMKRGMVFLPDEVWDYLSLPREEMK